MGRLRQTLNLGRHPWKELDGRTARVVRGGSWNNNERVNLRSAYRNNDDPRNRNDNNGFRVVLVGGGGKAWKGLQRSARCQAGTRPARPVPKKTRSLTRSTSPRNKSCARLLARPACRGKDAVPARGPVHQDHGPSFPPALLRQAPAMRPISSSLVVTKNSCRVAIQPRPWTMRQRLRRISISKLAARNSPARACGSNRATIMRSSKPNINKSSRWPNVWRWFLGMAALRSSVQPNNSSVSVTTGGGS